MLPSNYISAVYIIIRKRGLIEEKEAIVSNFTNGRTTSVRQMKLREAQELIRKLQTPEGKEEEEKRVKMINTIYSLAYQMNMTHWVDGEEKVDTKRLNKLVKQLSPQNKPLQKHTKSELTVLVTIVRKYYKQRLNKQGFHEDTGL